jgi:hypothetical protein
VRFLVVASDVIYPAGAMKDYEFNFYLPFNGCPPPILRSKPLNTCKLRAISSRVM